jgi:hypothetical protein
MTRFGLPAVVFLVLVAGDAEARFFRKRCRSSCQPCRPAVSVCHTYAVPVTAPIVITAVRQGSTTWPYPPDPPAGVIDATQPVYVIARHNYNPMGFPFPGAKVYNLGPAGGGPFAPAVHPAEVGGGIVPLDWYAYYTVTYPLPPLSPKTKYHVYIVDPKYNYSAGPVEIITK